MTMPAPTVKPRAQFQPPRPPLQPASVMVPEPYARRKVATGKARYVSGAAAHFSFLVHSPNVMKECAPPPPDGVALDPLKPGALRKATIMAGVALLELSRAAGA